LSEMVWRVRVGGRLGPVFAAVGLGLALGLLTRKVISWAGGSNYRLAIVACLILFIIGVVVSGDARKVLLVGLALTIPVNLSFSPLGQPVVGNPGGAAAGFVLYLYDLSLLPLLVIWLFDSLSGKEPFIVTPVDVVALLVIVWSVFSMYNAPDLGLSAAELLRMLKLYLLARAAMTYVKGQTMMRWVLAALFVGLIGQSLLTLLQYTRGASFGLGDFTVGDASVSGVRVSGTIGWPNTLGAYAAALTVLAFSVWVCGASGVLGLLVPIAFVAGLAPVILSFSRGAWFSLMIALMICFGLAVYARRTSFRRLVAVGAGIVVAVILVLPFQDAIVQRLSTLTASASQVVDRLYLDQVALNMIRHHALLGIGINNFVAVMPGYDTTGVSLYFLQPVHNWFLFVAAETGLPGLALRLLLLGLLFWAGLRTARSADRFWAACGIGLVGAFLVLCATNLVDVHLSTDVMQGLFWLLVGMTLAAGRLAVMANEREAGVAPRVAPAGPAGQGSLAFMRTPDDLAGPF
jgi:putative inorganic carbon (HCO3(-)) transporter